MTEATEEFELKSSATKVGESGDFTITWKTEQVMYLKSGESYITLAMPKANVFYKDDLDKLKGRCLGVTSNYKVCCPNDVTAATLTYTNCATDECCPLTESSGDTCTSSGNAIPFCSHSRTTNPVVPLDACPGTANGFYDNSLLEDFMPKSLMSLPTSSTNVRVAVAYISVADSNVSGSFNAEITESDMALLIDRGNYCWAK